LFQINHFKILISLIRKKSNFTFQSRKE